MIENPMVGMRVLLVKDCACCSVNKKGDVGIIVEVDQEDMSRSENPRIMPLAIVFNGADRHQWHSLSCVELVPGGMAYIKEF